MVWRNDLRQLNRGPRSPDYRSIKDLARVAHCHSQTISRYVRELLALFEETERKIG